MVDERGKLAGATARPAPSASAPTLTVRAVVVETSNAKPGIGQPVDFVARFPASARPAKVDGALFLISGPGVAAGTSLPASGRVPPSAGPPRLGIIGRFSAQKRHGVLLEALTRLPAGSCRLSIIGGADEGIKERITSLGLSGSVSWPGFIADRAAIYRELDIVVAPAVDEGFGMTAIEAGAYGLPVIAARSGAFPEVVRDGETGLLVAPDDPEALAKALQRLIASSDLRRRLGDAARAHVAASFTVEKMADRFVAALI